jgi:hypothetical protein
VDPAQAIPDKKQAAITKLGYFIDLLQEIADL